MINCKVQVNGLVNNSLPVLCIGATVKIDPSDTQKSHSGTTTGDGIAPVKVPQAGQYSIIAEFCHQIVTLEDVTISDDQKSFEVQLPLDDMWLEVSMDNGVTWTPAEQNYELLQRGPADVQLRWGPEYEDLQAFIALSPTPAMSQQRPNIVLAKRSALASPPAQTLAQQVRIPTSKLGPVPVFVAVAPNSKFGPPTFKAGESTFLSEVMPNPAIEPTNVNVSLRRTASRLTEDVPLWVAIRNGTDALSFDRYLDFMEWLFCGNDHPASGRPSIAFPQAANRALPFTDTDAYRNIKAATEAFVMANCGVFQPMHHHDARYVASQLSLDANELTLREAFHQYLENTEVPNTQVLPYLALIRSKLKDQGIKNADIGAERYTGELDWRAEVNTCYGLLKQRLMFPCLLELIWSYWQEEGMLNQTMNAISRRFQNVRGPLPNDPLANTEIDPLRPLNNILWGYVQDEQHRLSVVRRNYEYDHHYGLRLAGKAVNNMRTADSRSRFLEAFHTLLSIVSSFYKRDDDTTIVADGFPVLNALKEAHLILSQGAGNQFGDLPSTARIEMLMQQWILARPEFREFLPTRIMVAYPEPWMDRVDAMKKLQGWSDTSVLHFRNLATFGEQILLSVRYGAWADVNDPWQAVNWARYWRPEIQGYLHAYRSATSVDLSVDVTNARIDAVMPSIHLVKRLTEQKHRTA